jgi:hypothetical protein
MGLPIKALEGFRQLLTVIEELLEQAERTGARVLAKPRGNNLRKKHTKFTTLLCS